MIKLNPKLIPKKHICKLCGKPLSSYNYTNHLKNKHNTTKETYFKKHMPFLFKDTVRGIQKKKLRSFLIQVASSVALPYPKTKRACEHREAREYVLKLAKTVSGLKWIINNFDIISKNNWRVNRALIFVWCDNTKEEIQEKIDWLEKNKADACSPEYMKIYKGQEWYANYKKEQSENIAGEKNPGFRHGGKLSPFSEKFVKYSSHEEYTKGLKNVSEKSSKTKQENPERETSRIEYWLARFPEKEARQRYKERQSTFSLARCISKLGEMEGRKKWAARQEQWQNTLGAKTDEEKADINRRKCGNGSNISKQERVLVAEINEILDSEVETQFTISYGRNNGYIYDIFFNNRIIEYFGDFWHANPDLYPDTFVNCVSKKSYQDIRKRDEDRIHLAKSKGYQIKIVWEKDFKEDATKIIAECVEFLTNESI